MEHCTTAPKVAAVLNRLAAIACCLLTGGHVALGCCFHHDHPAGGEHGAAAVWHDPACGAGHSDDCPHDSRESHESDCCGHARCMFTTALAPTSASEWTPQPVWTSTVDETLARANRTFAAVTVEVILPGRASVPIHLAYCVLLI